MPHYLNLQKTITSFRYIDFWPKISLVMDPPDLEKKQDGIKVLKYVNIVSKREQKNKAKAKKQHKSSWPVSIRRWLKHFESKKTPYIFVYLGR